jgi:hypothetical protein
LNFKTVSANLHIVADTDGLRKAKNGLLLIVIFQPIEQHSRVVAGVEKVFDFFGHNSDLIHVEPLAPVGCLVEGRGLVVGTIFPVSRVLILGINRNSQAEGAAQGFDKIVVGINAMDTIDAVYVGSLDGITQVIGICLTTWRKSRK